MKKIELLSPVGDFECLKAAVQNGADSVYFGASSFNARASATNFDLRELKEAIEYAKLRGVNTHLTLNTLIKNEEFEDAILLAKKAYEFGIDAIIVQDLGLATYLINNFPNLPIHASTQMTIHNLNGAKQVEKLGFKRAVLSRELSLEEIEHICSNTNIEIETFIHGALCISYSGQCLFSSMIGGRSGNRGKCAQPCRLPYELKKEILENQYSENLNLQTSNSKISDFETLNKIPIKESTLNKGYLLSTRDLCGLSYIPQLINAGVMCFKIEGRMKSPEYVAIVTKIYRKYIDLALSGKKYVIDEKDKIDLAQVFNRGGFSNGHLDSNANKELVYKEKQNHMGIYLGNVSNIKESKGHIFLNLNNSLSIGDTIQFENEITKYTISELIIRNQNVKTANEKQLVEIGRMKGNINIGDKIYKLSSKELSNIANLSYQNENIKIKLDAKIIIKENLPISIIVKTNKHCPKIYKDIVVNMTSDIIPIVANSRPIDKERIISQLTKTNNTIFEFSNIEIELEDNLFIPSISKLNELRRNVLNDILSIAKSRIQRLSNSNILDNFNNNLSDNFISNNNTIINNSSINNLSNDNNEVIHTLEQSRNISLLLNILNENFDYSKLSNLNKIYIPLKYFSNKKYEKNILDISSKFNTYIYIPTIIKSNYYNILNNVVENSIEKYDIKGFVVSNISCGIFIQNLSEKYNKKFEFIANYTLNVYNSETINILKNLGISTYTLSPELDKKTLDSICKSNKMNTELIVYGNIPLMSTNYCFLGITNKCYPNCEMHCKNKNLKYYLKDRLGFKFRIIPDSVQTISTIYNSKITSLNGFEFNVDSYRIDILDETIEQINHIISSVKNRKRLEGNEFTNGNLNREI